MIAIDCNGYSLHIFKEKLCLWTKINTKQQLVLGASAFQFMLAGFLCPKCDNFSCLHTRQDQNVPNGQLDSAPKPIELFMVSLGANLQLLRTTVY